jgi:hypothetical protein
VVSWHTSCGLVYNQTEVGFEVSIFTSWRGPLGQEWQWVIHPIGAGGHITYSCSGAVDWECRDDAAIRGHAARFRSVWPSGNVRGAFYLFQDQDGLIRWTRMDDPSYAARTRTGLNTLCRCVEVMIEQYTDDVTEDMHRLPFYPRAIEVLDADRPARGP